MADPKKPTPTRITQADFVAARRSKQQRWLLFDRLASGVVQATRGVDESTRDDLHQEVVLACVAAWSKWNPSRPAFAYFNRIAWNRVHRFISRRAKQQHRDGRPFTDSLADGPLREMY